MKLVLLAYLIVGLLMFVICMCDEEARVDYLSGPLFDQIGELIIFLIFWPALT